MILRNETNPKRLKLTIMASKKLQNMLKQIIKR